MPAQSPLNLLPRIAAGDATAVEACLDEFAPTIHALAKRYLTPVKGDVEGAVQEVFVELWKNAARYDPARGSEATFIMTLAHRRLIDRQRWYASRFSVAQDALDAQPAVTSVRADANPAHRDEARAAAQALEQLPPDEQNVLRLAIHAGLTHERIAVVTGVPVGTVKTRIRRGLERLRHALGATPPVSISASSAKHTDQPASLRIADVLGPERPAVGGLP